MIKVEDLTDASQLHVNDVPTIGADVTTLDDEFLTRILGTISHLTTPATMNLQANTATTTDRLTTLDSYPNTGRRQ